MINIYTYYEPLALDNTGPQEEIISLWKESWSRQGYNPVVLGRGDAEEHSFFTHFTQGVSYLHECVTGKIITPYGLSCYIRWLAYANQKDYLGKFGKHFYVSDYDVINKKFSITYPIQQLHLMSGHCPCLVSGTCEQFLYLCQLFIKLTQNNLHNLKNIAMEGYHDQEFFLYNFKEYWNDCRYPNIVLTSQRPDIGDYCWFDQRDDYAKIFHVANHNVIDLKKLRPDIIYPDMDRHEARLKIIKHILND
tara:strand:+ start:2860 stop:3606 length:747 start_codon:yes stop_codon:yes gene_type:complete